MTSAKLATGLFCVALAGSTTADMSKADVRTVVGAIAQAITDNYVDADKARAIGRELRRARFAATDETMLAGEIGNLLRRHDGHFAVVYKAPEPAAETATGPDAGPSPAEFARFRNFGFSTVQVLRGNVGYIDLRMFATAADAGPTAAAAMSVLANVDSVIMDLRYNGGGDPAMVQLVCSYFLDGRQHLNSLYWRPTDSTTQFWSLPSVPGAKLADAPLFVLTSRRTASAAEEFAYNMQALERGAVVGERTAGAANPGEEFEPAPGWRIFVSTGKAINPVTGTNWEGTGVTPDVDVTSDSAFDVAYARALAALEPRSVQHDTELAWARAYAVARAVPEPVADLALIGGYGNRRILLLGDHLHYQRGTRSPWRLHGPVDGYFYAAESDQMRIAFGRDESGRAMTLNEVFLGGFSRTFAVNDAAGR